MSTKLDVSIARISHLQWELELETVARGSGQSQNFPSYQDCELGIWLHSRGHEQIEKKEIFDGLMNWHKQFHQAGEGILAQSMVKLDMQNQNSRIMNDLVTNLRISSRKIIEMLTQAELDYYGCDLNVPSLSQPVLGFLSRFLKGPHTAASEKTGILEINHARLVHLHWANHLPMTFRNRGRHVALEPSELCALGVWIHGTGLKNFGQMPEMARCDQAHQDFHTRAQAVLHNLRRHRDQHADKAYSDVLDLSREIIYLLSVIEYRLLGDASIHRFASLISL